MSHTFSPPLLLRNPHLQTLYATLFRKERLVGYVEELFTLEDGDVVECVWYPHKPKEKEPVAVLFHGLEGSIDSPYIVGMMKELAWRGYVSVLMQFRGCGREPNRKPRAYHSGDTADAKAWISHLHRLYPDTPLYAAGFSIGGNVLLKLLGEWGSDAPIRAAAAVSVPMRLDISAMTLEHGFARIYQRHLLTSLKKNLLEKYRRFDIASMTGVPASQIEKIRTIREFDAAYTAPVHGFASVDDYYTRASSRQYLKGITVPTLVIHALDDPFMTPEVLLQERELSKSVRLEVYQHGGHVGFVTGSLWRPRYWLEERIGTFFSSWHL